MTRPHQPDITDTFNALLVEADEKDSPTIVLQTLELAALMLFVDKQQAHLEAAYKRLNRYTVSALQLKRPEEDSTDYVLSGRSCWLEIGSAELYIYKKGDGVVVEAFRKARENALGDPPVALELSSDDVLVRFDPKSH